jgi:hypothetical protein
MGVMKMTKKSKESDADEDDQATYNHHKSSLVYAVTFVYL